MGPEIQKIRPCLVISNDAQNKKSSRLIIAPITSQVKTVYPFEVKIQINNQAGKVLLDQIRAIDKQRISKKIGAADYLNSYRN